MWQLKFLKFAFIWLVFFAAPDPRHAYDWLFGSGIHHPSYLFADSDREVCRRVRRVVENGKANIYVENLSSHRHQIYLNHQQMRALINTCHILLQRRG